jgi:hypothetical protein
MPVGPLNSTRLNHRRVLSFIVFCIMLEIVLLVLLLLEVGSLLRGLGFSDYDSGSLPIYLTLPCVLAVPLVWTRLVLKVRWPSPTHALSHLRRVPLPRWLMDYSSPFT